jgi:uncharacterized short protein YbdD (DUF466 family)
MKRLDIISDKIKNTKTNYFGRGHFENIIKEKRSLILDWFEELKPVQEQIKELKELGCEGLQKRNYVRIITKLFPTEYAQFIALNILLRDIDSIAAVFKGIHDTRKQYDTLLEHQKLKYPGKHQKYVEFHTYQQFVSFYKNDLINRVQNFDIDTSIEIEPNQQFIYNVHAQKNTQKSEEEALQTQTVIKDTVAKQDKSEESNAQTDSKVEPSKHKEPTKEDKKDKEKTNWMKVLLKGV